MPQTEAQARATAKYLHKFKDIKVRVPDDGTRERFQAQADRKGKSLNAYIIALIEADILKSAEK